MHENELRELLCNERHKSIDKRFDEGDRRMDEMNGDIKKILYTGITSLLAILTTLLVIIFK